VPWAFFIKAGHPGAVAADIHQYLLADALSQPFSAFPKPGHYDALPTVAMVTPDARDDIASTSRITACSRPSNAFSASRP